MSYYEVIKSAVDNAVNSPELQQRVDEVDANTFYIGWAGSKALSSENCWKIQKVSVLGNLVSKSFADGSTLFDKAWDNRTNYNY